MLNPFDIMPAKLVGSITVLAVGAVAIAAIGFGAAEVFEHRGHTPKPLSWVFGQSLAYQRDTEHDEQAKIAKAAQSLGMELQFKADAIKFDEWRTRLNICEGQRDEAQADATAALSKASKFTTTQAAQAYALGRATCETPHATPSASDAGLRPPVGLPDASDDLRKLTAPSAFTAVSKDALPR